MKRNKRKISVAAIYGIAALAFLIIFVAIPFPKPAVSWIMFAFSIASFAIGLGITLYAFGKSDRLVGKFYGFPVFRIGFIYTALQLIFSIAVFATGSFINIPYWVGIIICVLLLGMAAIGVIATDSARDYAKEIDGKTDSTTKTMIKFNNEIEDILGLCKSDTIKKPLEKLATKFKYSDPVSSPETEEKERDIEAGLEKLRTLVAANREQEAVAQARVVWGALDSRNRVCESAK